MKLLLSVFLLILVSCGRSDSDSREKKVTAMCPHAGFECQSELVAWTINSSTVNFPSKYQIKLNDVVLLDGCKERNIFSETETTGRMNIQFKLALLPLQAPKVLITVCESNAIFHEEDDVLYGVIVLTNQDRKTFSVSLNLNN